jgi:hypothetical protein
MGDTTTAQLTDTIPTIIESAQFTRMHKNVMRGLSWNVRKGKGSTVNIPYFNTAVSHQLSEGIDMVNAETMLDTNVQVTPYEAGLKIVLTKNVVEDDNEDLIRAAGRLMGDSYELKVDQDLLGRLANGTNTVGGASTTLTMGQIAAGRALLAGNPVSAGGPAPLPYTFVHHPFVTLDIVDILTPLLPAAGTTQSAAGAMADAVLREYAVGRLFGMPVVEDGNVPLTGTSDYKGGIFATGPNGAILYCPAREPTIERDGGDGYDASLRGWELVYVGRYGVGNYLAGWCVTSYNDGTTPA